MDLPVEIVRKILGHYLNQLESNLNLTNSKVLVKDINSLVSVSKYFRAMVMKVKYQAVSFGDRIIFFINGFSAIKVSYAKFNDYIEFITSNGLSFNIAELLKEVSMPLSHHALDTLNQLCNHSQVNLNRIDFKGFYSADLAVTLEVRKSVASLIKTLRTLRLEYNEDKKLINGLEFYPPSHNIEEITLSANHVEAYGVQRLNAHKSIKRMELNMEDDLNTLCLDGLSLELQHLTFELLPSRSLSNFNSCIKSLTYLVIHVTESYLDFLQFIPSFVNLNVLKVTACNRVTANFYPSLFEIVCLKLTNIQTLVFDNGSSCILLYAINKTRRTEVEIRESSTAVIRFTITSER